MLAHFGHHVVGAMLVPLMPMIRSELALNYAQSGVVLSAFAITSGISQLPAGWLADRIGPRIVVTMGIAGVALTGLLVGLSQTYFMIIIFLVLMAVMSGGYHPAAAAVIGGAVEPQNRGRAFGIHLIGGTASMFVAPLLAAAIALAWGWRGSYITIAVPIFILGIAIYILLGRQSRVMGFKTPKTDNAVDKAPAPYNRYRVIVFLLLSISVGALMHSMRAFIPLYMVDQFDVAEEAAAAMIALPSLAGLWAAPLGGYLSDRIGRIPMMIVFCLLAGPVVYMFNFVSYGLAFGAILLIYGTINSSRIPTEEAFIIEHTSPHRRSTVLGIYYFSGREMGGVLTSVIGYIIEHYGFRHSITIISAALVSITLICSVFLWGSRER